MTISSQKSNEIYEGNNSTRTFPFTFKVLDKTHLVVTKADSEGVETELILDTDYSVSGVGQDGGNVTYPKNAELSPLPYGHKLAINRVLPLTQLTDFENQGGFFPETHEDALDAAAMRDQQLAEEVKRCLKVSKTSGLDGEEYISEFETTLSEALETAQATLSAAQTLGSEIAANASAAEAAKDAAEAYANEFIKFSIESTASAGQTYVDISSSGHLLPTSLDGVCVYISGVKRAKSSLTRTSDTIITFGGALVGGELIEIVFGEFSPNAATEAAGYAASAAASAQAVASQASAMLSHLTATGAHGVATVVGTSEAQTLTNKTFDDAIKIKEISAPTSPSSGYKKLYIDSTTHRLMAKDSAGVVTEVGNAFSPTTIAAAAIDWASIGPFYKDISADITFTFSNATDGQTIVVIVKNSAATSKVVTMPTTINPDSSNTTTINAGKYCIFTFVKYGSNVFRSLINNAA